MKELAPLELIFRRSSLALCFAEPVHLDTRSARVR